MSRSAEVARPSTEPPCRKALYVTYDGLLEPLGGSQVLPYVEGLATRGRSMVVLSFEKRRDLEEGGRRQELAHRLRDAGIEWLPRRYHGWPSLPATALDLLVGAATVRRLVRSGQVGLIHARSYVGGLMALQGRRGRRGRPGQRGAGAPPIVFDMRGFWVDERLEAGMWKDGSLVVRAARRVERRLLEESDALVLLTRAGARTVDELAPGVELPPRYVIPTCVDLERFRPADDPAAARRRVGLETPGPVIVHTGALGTWYLDRATFAVGAAFARRTGGTFLVLTREEEKARALAREVEPPPVVRSVPFPEMPRWLAAADAGLALVRPGFAKGASAPTKVGEYLASGLAVAVTRVGDLPSQLDGSPVALTVSGATVEPDELAEGLSRAAARPTRREEARALARRHYDLAAGIGRYADVYRDMGLPPCE